MLTAAVLFALIASHRNVDALPAGFAEITDFMVAHGMGDPRGCEYREATVDLVPWLPKHSGTKIHGWVRKDRSVVAWNGLSYPSLVVGPPANLEADVRQARPRDIGDQAELFFSPFYLEDGPAQPTAPALLIVLGRADLAKLYFQSPDPRETRRAPQFLVSHYVNTKIWYISQSFANGLDQVALREGTGLISFNAALEKKSFPFLESRANLPSSTPHVDPMPRLVADAKRRLKTKKLEPDLNAISKLPPGPRVKELIEAMDDIRVGVSMDGRPSVVGTPIIRALKAEGDAAIEPLIDAYEKDTRLTRAGGLIQNWGDPSAYFVPVKDAALTALRDILQIQNPSYGPITVAELRRLAKERRGSPPPSAGSRSG